jgi:hypothetical protein
VSTIGGSQSILAAQNLAKIARIPSVFKPARTANSANLAISAVFLSKPDGK